MGAQAEEDGLMRTIVSDTGPILHLAEAGALSLLCTAGVVVISTVVFQELGAIVDASQLADMNWLQVRSLEPNHLGTALDWQESGILHAGEAESLALARQTGADWYLTDDAAARLLASSLGVEVHGSLGVVLWAAATGHLSQDDARTCLRKLAGSSLWISKRVLVEAQSALDELFSI